MYQATCAPRHYMNAESDLWLQQMKREVAARIDAQDRRWEVPTHRIRRNRFQFSRRLGAPLPPAVALAAAAHPAAAALFSETSRSKGNRRRADKVVVTTSISRDELLDIVRHGALLAGFNEKSASDDTVYLESTDGLDVLVLVTSLLGVTRMVMMHTGTRLAHGHAPTFASVRPLSDTVERTVRSTYPLADFRYSDV
jgi:hypothetical protein